MSNTTDDELLPVLRAALDQTWSAACITTADLDPPGPTIVYVNPAYCTMTGRKAEHVIGESPRIMQGPLTSRAVLDRLRAELEAGRSFVGETVNYRSDGEPFLISWRIDPVVDLVGEVTHYIATQNDITAIRRAERLIDAGRAIDRSLSTVLSRPADSTANLDALASDIVTAVEEMLDYGTVGVVGAIRLGTTARPFRAGRLDRRHDHLADRIRSSGAASAVGVDDEGRHWLGCSMSNEPGGISGAVVVADLDQAELSFSDRSGLEHVAASARRALESLAEYERQRLVAVELQRGLLPDRSPQVAGFELSAHYQPGAFASRIGGDWYDVITEAGRPTVLVVGDMAGSGIRAAADMGRVSLLTRVLLQQGHSVPETFTMLNRFCAEQGLLATALAVTLDPSAGLATVVSAGHLPPVVRRQGHAELASMTVSPPLGIGGDPAYAERPLSIGVGDTVVLYTDGLIERFDELLDDSLGTLVGRLAADDGAWEGLVDRLVAASVGEQPSDDIAILAFRLLGDDGDDR